jgi:hypothetical protein
MTPDAYHAREAVYGKLAELSDALKKPLVAVVLDGEEAHVHIEVPATQDVRDLILAGQKAYWALTLYLQQLGELAQREAAAGEARNSADGAS